MNYKEEDGGNNDEFDDAAVKDLARKFIYRQEPSMSPIIVKI